MEWDSIAQQAEAWEAVCHALNEVCPNWLKRHSDKNGMGAAVATIKELAAGNQLKLKPFDPRQVKLGSLVVFNGTLAQWVGESSKHPEGKPRYIIENAAGLSYATEDELLMFPGVYLKCIEYTG